MQSIIIPIVIGPNSIPTEPFLLPIIDRTEFDRRVNEVVKKKVFQGLTNEQNCINSRSLFETHSRELLCFPVKKKKSPKPREMQLNDLALFNMGRSWGIAVCFFSQDKSRISHIRDSQSFEIPEEAREAVKVFLPGLSVSLFLCEAGRITTSSSGQAVLEGLELMFLQNAEYRRRGLLCKKTLYQNFPDRPLQDTEEGARAHSDNMTSFIKVRCCCKWPGFSFIIKLPLLTQNELQLEIQNLRFSTPEAHHRNRVQMKIEHHNLFPVIQDCHHVISFPRNMGLHCPFDGFLGGRLVCSYEEATLALQVAFIPDILKKSRQTSISYQRSYDCWGTENCQFSITAVKLNQVSVYSHHRVRIVPGSVSEKYISGAEMKLVSTSRGGSWGILVSRAEASSSPDASSGEVDNNPASSTLLSMYHLGYRLPLSFFHQAASTAYISPDRQGKHTQKKGIIRPILGMPVMHNSYQPVGQWEKKCFVPGPSGVRQHPYAQCGPRPSGFGLYPFPRATGSFSSEGQKQQAKQGGKNNPENHYFPPSASTAIDPLAPEDPQQRIIRPFPVRHQPVSTVSDPLEGQSQHNGPWNRRGFVPGLFDDRHHLYAQGEPEPSGSSDCTPSTSFAQSAASIFVPLEGQTQHTGAWDRRGFMPGPFGVRRHPYAQGLYPYGFPYPPPGTTGPFLSEEQQQAQQGERHRSFRPHFLPSASAVRPSVMAFNLLAPEALQPQQGVEPSQRASVIVSLGTVRQMPIWNSDEEKAADSTVEAPEQAQEEKYDEDLDVEN